jgi:hypothetical protein
MHYSSVFHKPAPSGKIANQIQHPFSTSFLLQLGYCPLIHAFSWHNPNKSGFSASVPGVESREGARFLNLCSRRNALPEAQGSTEE